MRLNLLSFWRTVNWLRGLLNFSVWARALHWNPSFACIQQLNLRKLCHRLAGRKSSHQAVISACELAVADELLQTSYSAAQGHTCYCFFQSVRLQLCNCHRGDRCVFITVCTRLRARASPNRQRNLSTHQQFSLLQYLDLRE